MNHPTREEWMSYLCDELNAAERAPLDAHRKACPDCEGRVRDWQATRRNLDDWKLPARRVRFASTRPVRPALAWAVAAAAVLALGVGFSVGWFTSTTLNGAKLRAAIQPEVQQQLGAARTELRLEFAGWLRAELDKSVAATLAASSDQARDLIAEYARLSEIRRADDSQAISAALGRLEAQRAADFLSLKKDLDTVAVNTDAGLRRTEQQLTQLADSTRPAGSLNSIQ